MITMMIAGFGLIVLVAILVQTADTLRAAEWRDVAAQRREHWEQRQQEAETEARRG